MPGVRTAVSERPRPPHPSAGGAATELADSNEFDTAPDEHEEGDGRKRRRNRNRENVIIALLDIVRSGELEPSVADIAEAAGVSHRSIFRYFENLDDLVRAAIDYEVARSIHLATIPEVGFGPLEGRIGSWVDSRIRVHSATYQLGRVARYRAVGIPSIDEGLKGIYHLGRARMNTHFAEERDALGDEADLMLDAAMVLTGFESYDLQHRIIGHSTEQIRRVWVLALDALFTRTLAG